MKKWLVVLLVFGIIARVVAQQHWSKEYPKIPTSIEHALGIWPVDGGGYLAARDVRKWGNNEKTFCELLRLDELGIIQSIIQVPPPPGISVYEIHEVLPLLNGDLLFLGETSLYPYLQYLWRLRLDGTSVWSKTISPPTGTSTSGIHATELSDGQLVWLQTGNQSKGAFLNYYDAAGNFIKKSALPDSLDAGFECDRGRSLGASDGHWITIHNKFDSIFKQEALFYSPDHRLLWQKQVYKDINSMTITPGGNLAMSTIEIDTIAHRARVYLVKIDSTGQEVWNTVLLDYPFYGTDSYDVPGVQITTTHDGGYTGFFTYDTYFDKRITDQPSYHFFKVRSDGTLANARDFAWPAPVRFFSGLRYISSTSQGDVIGFNSAISSLFPYIEEHSWAFKMDSMGFFQPHRIIGAVQMDPNASCAPNPLARSLEGCMIRLDRAGMPPQYAHTDSLGQFLFETEGSAFTLTAIAPGPHWKICTPPQIIQPTSQYDTLRVAFSAQPNTNDPVIAVDVVMPELKRCQTKTFDVHYANRGIVETDSILVSILLDPAMTFISAGIMPRKIAGDTLIFRLKGLPAGGRSKIAVKAKLDCNGLVSGQAHTLHAWASVPQLDDLPPGWSGSDLRVSAVCQQDSAIQFRISNKGSAPSGGLAAYQVLHDHFLLQEGVVPSLLPGQSILRTFPSEAGYWRLEVKQESSNPWGEYSSAALQSCAGPGSNLALPLLFTTNDNAPFEAIENRANDSKWQVNEIIPSPVGYGAAHLVRAGDDIEYTLYFKNTTDKIGTGVRVLDTLSEWLDMSTLRVISASHSYHLFISDDRVLRFDFSETNLKQDFLYPEQSGGYVRFRLRPKLNIPLGTRIENRAKVWFNYTYPTVSETVWHTIGDPLKSVSVDELPSAPNPLLSIVPNPASASARLYLTSGDQGPHHLLLTDPSGRVLRHTTFIGEAFELQREGLPPGLYFVQIIGTDQRRAVGKIVFAD